MAKSEVINLILYLLPILYACNIFYNNVIFQHWNDRKSRLKRRQAEIRASQKTTGGGPPSDDELDPTEEKLIKLMGGEVCIAGHTNVKEVGVPSSQLLQVINF